MFDIFETRKVDGKLVVHIGVPPGQRTDETRVVIKTPDVIRFLKEKEIAHGACLEQSCIRNYRPAETSATWVFELPATSPKLSAKAPPKKTVRSRVSLGAKAKTSKK
tara:strand:+ start:163 stop:483 length:321 start_codon:yes stop_codon:yes gene_type:complete